MREVKSFSCSMRPGAREAKRLEQCPELGVFTQIASRASNDEIFRAIGATTRKRDDVINMIRCTNSLLAVVAFALLIFVLIADISTGMSAISGLFTCASIASVYFIEF